jgi:hypothetical protein
VGAAISPVLIVRNRARSVLRLPSAGLLCKGPEEAHFPKRAFFRFAALGKTVDAAGEPDAMALTVCSL